MTESNDKINEEISQFQEMELNALPEIFSYYANRHLVPFFAQAFDTGYLFDILANELLSSIRASQNPLIVSIGAGDGEIEVEVAKRIPDQALRELRIECLELSPALIERGRARVAGAGLSNQIEFKSVDLSHWCPERRFGAVLANQSLHHIEALEHVFDTIHEHMDDFGSFVTSDMIGRNGHMRWPETLAIINALWVVIPERWKYNQQLRRFEEKFINHDCSTVGFEGVRAQEILPELLKRFHVRKFAAWGGLLDPFIDRAFGNNLDPSNELDREFIDTLWESNQTLIASGSITPTNMVAVMTKEHGDMVSAGGVLPTNCIRPALV